MKVLLPILLVFTGLLTGCDYIYGVSRSASVHKLPNLQDVKSRIETYPEIGGVDLSQRAGSRPLTWTGIKDPDEVFYLSYKGGENVHGTLMFTRNYKGDVRYDQYLIDINRRPPQIWIDSTWPVMKKIERDLEEHFGLPEICDSVKVWIYKVEDPDRKVPNELPLQTPTSGTPVADAPVAPPSGAAGR